MTDPPIDVNQAIALYNAGQATEAEALCRRIPATSAQHPYALHLLALIALDRRRPGEAEEQLRKAISLRGDEPLFHASLARVLVSASERKKAISALERAVELAPSRPDLLDQLMTQLMWANDYAQALRRSEQLLALKPSDPAAISARAMCLHRLDRTDDARSFLQPYLDAPDVDDRIIGAAGRLAESPRERREIITKLSACLSRAGMPDHRREMLHFALADHLAALGEHDEAFRHYQAGNCVVPSAWRPEQHEHFISALMQVYSPAFCRTMPRSGAADDRPVFIVGMPRTGTSLIEQVLGCHSRLTPGGERHDILHMAMELDRRLGARGVYPGGMRQVSQLQLRALADFYARELPAPAAGELRFTDKLPNNLIYLGLIAQVLPAARIIYCVRDPMDTCFSCYTKNFGNMHAYAKSLTDLGAYSLRQDRLMRHWMSVLDLSIIELRYEAMIDDLEGEVRRVLAFLGLEFEEACLRFHESNRRLQTASHDQIRRPLYRDAIGKHQPYLKHLGPLLDALSDLLGQRVDER